MTLPSQPILDPHVGLNTAISPPRFATFLSAAAGDVALAHRLYVWNLDLSVAVLADIAIVEVALRNAMHDAASRVWGSHWYQSTDVLLDERSEGQLSRAFGYLHKSIKQRANDADVPGRVVAQCMFGFWVNLLDSGDHVGRAPRRRRADYNVLWETAFKHAFPGARLEARAQRKILEAKIPDGPDRAAQVARLRQEVAFNRTWVHGICKNVNGLRNRVAHHEPLINGLPLAGQGQRITAAEAHGQVLMVARMIDRDLATWLDTNSKVPALLANRPS
ncbi:hypothetical protein [Microbacterium arborescens]